MHTLHFFFYKAAKLSFNPKLNKQQYHMYTILKAHKSNVIYRAHSQVWFQFVLHATFAMSNSKSDSFGVFMYLFLYDFDLFRYFHSKRK